MSTVSGVPRIVLRGGDSGHYLSLHRLFSSYVKEIEFSSYKIGFLNLYLAIIGRYRQYRYNQGFFSVNLSVLTENFLYVFRQMTE